MSTPPQPQRSQSVIRTPSYGRKKSSGAWREVQRSAANNDANDWQEIAPQWGNDTVDDHPPDPAAIAKAAAEAEAKALADTRLAAWLASRAARKIA